MILSALSEAVSRLLKNPFLWVPGLTLGGLAGADIVLQYFLGTFFVTRFWIVEALAVPFFLAAVYVAIREKAEPALSFVQGGSRYYFRVLLPILVILFAILATIVLLAVPLSFAGDPTVLLPFITLGSAVPILFFTFFADCAAVFEDCRVFESIRRSVEIVLSRPGPVILFFLASAGILLLVSLPLMVLWTGLLYERLLPLTAMDPAELQQVSMETFNGMLGLEGIVISALLAFAWFCLAGNLLLAFKAIFYRELVGEAGQGAITQLKGEYDEKGRWYRY